MEVALNILTAALCVSGPLFFCISMLLTALFLRYKRSAKESALIRNGKIIELECLVQKLQEDSLQVARNDWLENIDKTKYHNEIEVEIKFIYPLLQFLGYENKNLQVRVPVVVQIGRQRSKGEADWVIWDTLGGKPSQAVAIIEAKRVDCQLDEVVQEQARSYAFGLNAPVYVLTNGHMLRVFRRGVQGDICVIDCDTNYLRNYWGEIEKVLGANVCLSSYKLRDFDSAISGVGDMNQTEKLL